MRHFRPACCYLPQLLSPTPNHVVQTLLRLLEPRPPGPLACGLVRYMFFSEQGKYAYLLPRFLIEADPTFCEVQPCCVFKQLETDLEFSEKRLFSQQGSHNR